jgi:hypothetical protein
LKKRAAGDTMEKQAARRHFGAVRIETKQNNR